jgi:hypothetical protein
MNPGNRSSHASISFFAILVTLVSRYALLAASPPANRSLQNQLSRNRLSAKLDDLNAEVIKMM